MLIFAWTIGLIAVLALLCTIPWLGAQFVKSLHHHWRSASASGTAFNPLLEFVQPRACHVVEVEEQRVARAGEGAAPEPPDHLASRESD
jgi:hypothetical protein